MCAPVAVGVAGLVLSGIGTAVNYSMGIASANQQAAQANSMALMQANQAQASVAMQNQQALQQQAQVRAQMEMQRAQQQQANQLAMQQQMSQQSFALQQQAMTQSFQQQSQLSQQAFQASTQAMSMEQALAQQERQQALSVSQQQSAIQFQREQAQKAQNLQIEQMNKQLLDKYTQQRAAVKAEREQLMKKYEVDKQVYQDTVETAELQKDENAAAANRAYLAEQAQLDEKRKEAAFESQSIIAKSIGAKGSILASGRTGQSVGLLVNDVERQAGIAKAQQTAMLESDRVAAILGMQDAYEQNRAADQQADASVGFDPTMPYLPQMPEVPTFVGFEIPT